jgi:hypothetical protein
MQKTLSDIWRKFSMWEYNKQIAIFRGHPDSDNKIEDSHGQMPTVFGLERYNGCPVPDQIRTE